MSNNPNTLNQAPSDYTPEENAEVRRLSMQEIADLPDGVFIPDCSSNEESPTYLQVSNLYENGLQSRLRSKGLTKDIPEDTETWPDEYYYAYDIIPSLAQDYDANGTLAIHEAIKNAHMHGNRNSTAQDVAVAAGWLENKFYFAVRDHGKGIQEGKASGAKGMNGMGLYIIFNWGGEDSYDEVTDENHTFTLVRDLDAVKEPPISNDGYYMGARVSKVERQLDTVRNMIRQGTPLPLKPVRKSTARYYDSELGKMVPFDDQGRRRS